MQVFESLISGTLPVYKGASNILNFLPDPSSVVLANGMSPEELGALLLHLSQHEDAYNKYFEYKHRNISTAFDSMAKLSYAHPDSLCRMCNFAAGYRSRQLQV